MEADAENKKAIIFTACFVLAVLLVAGGFWLGSRHKGQVTVNSSNVGSSSDSSTGGLSVNSGATNLGQLGTSSQGSTGGSSQGSSTDSSAGSSPVDPSTFAQYDKYKSNPSALFGDVQVGTGAAIGVNQKATISYKGWLTDGTLFDQSQSFSFTLGAHQVISGMEEGVDGMKVGGTRLIIIPPALGYGAQGQGSIPGNAVLVFEVSLLDAT